MDLRGAQPVSQGGWLEERKEALFSCRLSPKIRGDGGRWGTLKREVVPENDMNENETDLGWSKEATQTLLSGLPKLRHCLLSNQTALVWFSVQRRVLPMRTGNQGREDSATESRYSGANLEGLHFRAFPIFSPDSISYPGQQSLRGCLQSPTHPRALASPRRPTPLCQPSWWGGEGFL